MLAMGFSCVAFIVLWYDLSVPVFFQASIMKGCYVLSDTFVSPVDMICNFLSFVLFVCDCAFVDLHAVSHPCISGKKQT